MLISAIGPSELTIISCCAVAAALVIAAIIVAVVSGSKSKKAGGEQQPSQSQDAPQDAISSLAGKIGNLDGISVKTVCSNVQYTD